MKESLRAREVFMGAPGEGKSEIGDMKYDN
jgi:hypothetical protein